MSDPVLGGGPGTDARGLRHLTQLGNRRASGSLGTDIETGRHHDLPCPLTSRRHGMVTTGPRGIPTAYA